MGHFLPRVFGLAAICIAGKSCWVSSLHVASLFSDAVAVFARHKTTGALTELPGTAGCVSETGTGGACADGTALDNAVSVAVSRDGKHV